MKRNVSCCLSVLIGLIIVLTGCSDKKEYTNAVPADTQVLARFDLVAIAQKSGLNDKENQATKSKLMDALKEGMGAAAYKQMEKIIADPAESGLALNQPVYLFSSRGLPYPTLLIKVDNEEKVTATLEAMASEQLCKKPVEEGDYYFTTMTDGSVCMYNEGTFMLVSGTVNAASKEVQTTVAKLFDQDAEKSGVKNKGFIKMEQQKGDITFFASMRDLPEAYTKQIAFGLSDDVDLREVFVLGALRFENGKISINYETYSENKELNAQLDKQQKAFGKLKSSLTNLFPASTVAYISMNIKGKDLYGILSENREFQNAFIGAERKEVKNFITHVNGEVAVAITDFSMFGIPGFIAYAEIDNDEAVSALKKYAMTSFIPMYAGKSGNLAYLTNNRALVASVGKTTENSLTSAPFASNIAGNSFYFALNAENILNLSAINELSSYGEEFAMYRNIASQISFLEVKGYDNGKGEAALVLKDPKTNALKQMVNFAKQFTGL